MINLVRTVAPAVLPVSLDEAKAHLRVDITTDDALITSMIKAATSYLDARKAYGRALITQTWRADFAAFSDMMRLPIRDALTVSSITYYDNFNVSQTLATSVYQLHADDGGSYIALKPDQTWPSVYSRVDAVRVTWTAGFGPAASDVPEEVRLAIIAAVATHYQIRENVVIGPTVAELPMAAHHLLDASRIVSF